jgi:hypothetical protein
MTENMNTVAVKGCTSIYPAFIAAAEVIEVQQNQPHEPQHNTCQNPIA